jgi:hypothetical protein
VRSLTEWHVVDGHQGRPVCERCIVRVDRNGALRELASSLNVACGIASASEMSVASCDSDDSPSPVPVSVWNYFCSDKEIVGQCGACGGAMLNNHRGEFVIWYRPSATDAGVSERPICGRSCGSYAHGHRSP